MKDTRILVQHVRDSDVFVVLLTSDVMMRPWCILEIHAAVSAGVPVVGVTLRGKGYDHATANRQLSFLDTELDRLNPGASAVLRENGLEPLDAAKNFVVVSKGNQRICLFTAAFRGPGPWQGCRKLLAELPNATKEC